MGRARFRIMGLLIIFVALCVVAIAQTDRSARERGRERIKEERSSDYRFRNTYDLNEDGSVDSEDRQQWIKGSEEDIDYSGVYPVDRDAADTGIVDIDGDGNVEPWELNRYFDQVDADQDGVLDDPDLGQVTGTDTAE